MIHDDFSWWANIWIPSAVGLATIGVAVVALGTSAQAARIARESEKARVSDLALQRAEADRNRLLDTAQAEARLLRNYFQLNHDYRPQFGSGTLPDGQNPRTAGFVARNALEQSFVPGAASLWQITDFDMQTVWDDLPERPAPRVDDGGDVMPQIGPFDSDLISEARVKRTLERIRLWGVDPIGQVAAIEADLALSNSDKARYLTTCFDLPSLWAAHASSPTPL